MQVRQIELSAVVPNERNPRSDFGDLDALWESFAFNTANPGEPVNPIVVVADGDVYRILDGERRYRAMAGHGQETCHAVVCEGYDDMAQAVQMLATDDKLSLTAQEQCIGIQEMLLLGVDVQRVAGVSHASEDDIRKVRRVIRCRGYGKEYETYQATLDQMLAVADVDENGDGDLADELLSDRNWKQRYDKFCRERRNREMYEAYIDAAKDAGFVLLEGEWEDVDRDQYGPMAYAHGIEQFAELFEKGYRFAHIDESAYAPSAHVFLPAGAAAGKSEKEIERERRAAEEDAAREKYADLLERLRSDVGTWYMGKVCEGSPTQGNVALTSMATDALFGEDSRCDLPMLVDEFVELAGVEKPYTAPPQLTWELKAAAFPLVFPDPSNYSFLRALALGMDGVEVWGQDHAKRAASNLCAAVNPFVAAGYEPPEWADELMRKVEQVASWEQEADDGEDD